MTINALFLAQDRHWGSYRAPLEAAFAKAGLDAALSRAHAPEVVDYIIFAPGGPDTDFRPFTRAKAVFSLWAGVERIVGNDTLTQPLTRMVDDGLREGMRDWVVGHVMRHHLGMDEHICRTAPEWKPATPRLARDRPVTMLGLGALGMTCALALAALGFPVTGWSRSQKSAPALSRCLSGPTGLSEALTGAEIVVLLTPLTPETENLMNAETLALLAPGAVILNPGRGALIDDTALLAALDSGLGHATLDTFRTEPLPVDHPFWHHSRVTVTPHIAAETRPAISAGVVAENIRRGEAGEPFLHLVDRKAGY
jgi:glyoxylate/hydroxypyruvate reductase